MMNILLSDRNLAAGGVTTVLLNLAKYCNNVDFRFWVLSFSDKHTGKKADFSKYVAGFLLFKEPLWYYPWNLALLRRFLKKNEIRFVICNSAREVAIVWLAKIFLRVRLVVIVHGIPVLQRWHSTVILRLASRLASAFVVVSEHLRSQLIGRGFSPRIKVIPNGIELHPDVIVPREKNSPVFTFCMIARYCVEKDHQTVILAFQEFTRHRIDSTSFRLLLIGHGNLEILADCRNLVLQRSLQKSVIFADSDEPWVTHGKAIDCVIASSVAEGCPLVPVEAMSYGIPVIASDIPAHLEQMGNGQYGMLFKTGDKGDLSRKMAAMVDDNIFSHYSIEGMKRALDFDTVQTAKLWENLLTSLALGSSQFQS